MIRLANIFRRNPGRELSLIGHAQHRERVLAVARLMRAECGLPPSRALEA